DDAAKEKQKKVTQLIEQALADTQNLRLPENRAYFYAQIGNLMWPIDQEHATVLFQNAAAELISAQDFAESKRSSNPNSELLNGGSTRQQILNIIASRNAESALELLVKTRPLTIQKALAGSTDETSRKIDDYYQNRIYLAQNETSMEQNFYRMAADQNPERAVKLLKESLSKNLANDTYYQLQRLAEKDPAAASEMASRVVEKLLNSDYMVDGQPRYINIQLTNQILSNAMSNQGPKFDSGQIHNLASKLISAYLSDQQVAPYIGQSIIPIAEKFSPAALAQIKKRTAGASNQNQSSELDAAYQKLMEADTTPEQMLTAANKFSLDRRRGIYQSASNKFLGQGNSQAARNVLADNFSGETREQMLSNFDIQNTYNLISQSKFNEAEQVIDGLPEQQRVSMLINLANSVYSRDQKANKTYAQTLLAKAADLTSERPENSAEMGMLMQVIAGYSSIEPDEAFRLLEGLIPKINELTDAAAVINGFQMNSNVREGEFIMTQGDPFYNYGANASMVGTLAQSDFDRAMKLIDGFNRQELRVSLRLQVASSSALISNLPIQGRSVNISVFSSRRWR
ncbi:MAG TPA: hypothetical protein VEV84_07205, partial [Pyrinomonadaceae bacterium]|nr:hypothetical protein [Pyrinomonadaceae bacterium]